MTQQILKNRLGTPYFNDATTDLQCCLPEGLIIYSYTGRIWLGGSERPTDLLYIERVSAEIEAVPTILADGDLDLTLVSIGDSEELEAGAKGTRVAGNYRKQSFAGYLNLVPVNQDYQYLVMIASTNLADEENQRLVSLSVQDTLQVAAWSISVRD
ncbi:MAG: hypothetical protein AAF391_13345 [Bacteroidota bacterium]